MEDIDLNLDDFVARVNSDLVGKFVNIASRSAGFITKRFDGQAGRTASADLPAIKAIQDAAEPHRRALRSARIRQGDARNHAAGRRANQYVDEHKPWELAKQEGQRSRAARRLHSRLNLFRLLTLYLKPVLPKLADRSRTFLNIAPLTWGDAQSLLPPATHQRLPAPDDPYRPQADRSHDRSQQGIAGPDAGAAVAATPCPAPAGRSIGHSASRSPWEPYFNIDDFSKVDLRVARIVNAEHVEGADKLLR